MKEQSSFQKEQALRDAVKQLAKLSVSKGVSKEGEEILDNAATHLQAQIYGNGYLKNGINRS